MSELNRMSSAVALMVADSLANLAGGDRVRWDVSLQLLPTPQGVPQPVYLVLLQMPAPLLGQNLNHMVFIDVNDLTPVKIAPALKEAMDVLRTRHAEMLAQPAQLPNGLAALRDQAMRNGQS